MGLNVLVGEVISSPMHGGAKCFRTSSELLGVVHITPALHNIDLTTSRPFSIFIAAGECPDGRPQPVALGQLGLDLNSAVLEGEGINSCDFATHDRVDVVVAITGPAAAVEECSSALVGRRASPQFISVAGPDELSSDFVLSEDWLDVELAVLGKGRCPVVVVELELPVASSSEGDIMTPLAKIKEVEVILKDEL